MQKVLTAEQMREVDRLTTERFGIPSILLVENAAHADACVITEKLGGSVENKSILILCGPGNNGGDGAAIARLLEQSGAITFTILVGRIENTKGDARANFEILKSLGRDGSHDLWEIDDHSNDVSQLIQSSKFDLVVDAFFGTGLTRPISGPYDDILLDLIEIAEVPRISVDIPSGLNADLPDTIGYVFSPEITVTFTAPKVATVLPPAVDLCGEVRVADLGSPQQLIDEQPSQLFLVEKCDVKLWLDKSSFSSNSYKNKRGHALIVAGSEDYSGAAVMCGNSAMRSGVGLTTLLVPASCKVEVASRVIPEVIVRTLAEKDGEVSADAFAANAEVIGQANSILVGPGLKATDKGVERLVREIVENRTIPVVLDAGALGFFNPPGSRGHKPARKQGRIAQAGAEADRSSSEIALADARACATDLPPLILTPHEGEFMRLLGTDDKAAIQDRVAAVREFAVAKNVILVLKGERVLIGAPDGRVVVNPTGNSGLGKAGNGDTLAGILAGFVAQAVKFEIDIFETVVAAVYVAGMAGDVAERKCGKRVMTASDVRECLVEVFAALEEMV